MTPTRDQADVRSWRRIDGVDLLRGLSILFVLLNHVNMRLLFADVLYLVGLPKQLVYTLVWNGQAGVQMFFVISGFLITATSLRRWGGLQQMRAKEFYLLRVARIGPLLLLLLAVLSALHMVGVAGYVVGAKTGGLPRALLAAVTFHVNWLEATRGYLPANWDILWSLSVEEMFYLFFPLVARLASRRKGALQVLLVLLVIVGPFARAKRFNPNPVWREYSYLGGMDAIAMGALTALLLRERQPGRRAMQVAGCVGAVLLVFALGCSVLAYRWGMGRNGLLMTVLGLGASLLVAAAAETGWTAPRVLTPLQVLGQRSYEVYLTHMFGVMGLFWLFVRMGKPMGGVAVLFVSAIAVAGTVGWLVAVLFAEPANRGLRRLFGVDAGALGSATPQTD